MALSVAEWIQGMADLADALARATDETKWRDLSRELDMFAERLRLLAVR